MRPFQVRWQNFRSFEDTGWVSIRPLTIINGPNGSGKTSLLAPLLLLKQTMQAADQSLALKTRGDLFDAGSFVDVVRNHDPQQSMTLSFRKPRRPLSPSDLKPVGQYPPGEVALTFALPPDSSAPVLQQYEVLDTHGRLLLRRARSKDAKYTRKMPLLKPAQPAPSDPTARSARLAIASQLPTRFLFTPEPVIAKIFGKEPELRHQDSGTGVGLSVEAVQLDPSAVLYLGIVGFASAWIEALLRAVSFIGPLRDYPRRVYVLSGEHPPHVGTRGQWAPEIVHRQRSHEPLAHVNEWISRFGFGVQLKSIQCGDDAFSIMLQRSGGAVSHNLADTGFGLSQVLPLIVQGFCSDPESVILAEQPEIHLNPRLQSLLADLFAEVATSGRGVLLETHSEHLLLSVRRLVAAGTLRSRDVSLLYVESSGDGSSVREIPLHTNGHIDQDMWPKGFFEDSLREALGLAAEQSKGGRDAG